MDLVEVARSIAGIDVAEADKGQMVERLQLVARLRRALDAVKSAKAAEGCPFFADALARGEVSLGHLDAFARGLRSLSKQWAA